MQKRTKIIIRNILVAPFVIFITLPLEIISLILNATANFVSDTLMQITLMKFTRLPMTESQMKKQDEYWKAHKEDMIKQMKNSYNKEV